MYAYVCCYSYVCTRVMSCTYEQEYKYIRFSNIRAPQLYKRNLIKSVMQDPTTTTSGNVAITSQMLDDHEIEMRASSFAFNPFCRSAS